MVRVRRPRRLEKAPIRLSVRSANRWAQLFSKRKLSRAVRMIGPTLTRALQERAFFESQSYATAVYQSHLMYKLRELGYELERGRSGAPEIKGYSQEYLDASSPRSEKIREHLERNGFKGPEAAEIAAHRRR
jgi:conjugative relaxase-like TrwC/TraI family protein